MIPGKSAKKIILLILTFIFLISLSQNVSGASFVSAKYQSVANNKVVFLVEVGNPAPSSLIVSHKHPPSNRLLSSSPAATKMNQKAGVSKWLLKNVKPGVYPFSLSFKNPVVPRTVSLTVRHRDVASGKFQEKLIRP